MEQFNGDNIEAGHPNLIRLGVLINGIKNSKIALPEFQRSQVWSANEKKELVISMCLKIPIGSFLLWEFEDDVDVHKDTELRAFPKAKSRQKKRRFPVNRWPTELEFSL